MWKMSPILSQDCQLTIVHGSWLDNACDTCAIIFLGDEYCVCPILGLASRVAFTCGSSGSTAIFAVSLSAPQQFSMQYHSG
jgi:hypothetical protein